MQKNPKLFQEVFTYVATPLVATDLINLFAPQLSEVGNNKRMVENRTLCFWWDWLLEVEG